MKKLILKILVIIFIITLILSSVYLIFTLDSQEENKNSESTPPNNESQDDDDDTPTPSDDDDDISFEHYSFIEEATASWCTACPQVAHVLDKLSSTSKDKFYYVSLVHDKNNIAQNRLDNEYNIYGYPTIFIDGGYKVIRGNTNFESVFNNNLNEAKQRDRPDISIDIKSEWNESGEEINNEVVIHNYENSIYNGRLKIYITEIQSRWADYNGDPYHYGLIDYAYDKDIQINSNSNITVKKTWETSNSDYKDIYPENLFVFAVVFNSDSNSRYANPQDNTNSFDAYFVDGVAGTNISEGDLPPTIGISRPKQWHRYIFNKEGKKGISGETIILGKITIKANVEAESGVQKVDFFVNGKYREFTYSDNTAPYEWTWDKLAFGRYTVKVVITDKQGRTQEDTMDILAFNI